MWVHRFAYLRARHCFGEIIETAKRQDPTTDWKTDLFSLAELDKALDDGVVVCHPRHLTLTPSLAWHNVTVTGTVTLHTFTTVILFQISLSLTNLHRECSLLVLTHLRSQRQRWRHTRCTQAIHCDVLRDTPVTNKRTFFNEESSRRLNIKSPSNCSYSYQLAEVYWAEVTACEEENSRCRLWLLFEIFFLM